MATMFQNLPDYFTAVTIAYTFKGSFTNWQLVSPLGPRLFFQAVLDGIQTQQDCPVEITLEILSALSAGDCGVTLDSTKLQPQNADYVFDGDSKTLCIKYVTTVHAGNILRIRSDERGIPRGTIITIRNVQ